MSSLLRRYKALPFWRRFWFNPHILRRSGFVAFDSYLIWYNKTNTKSLEEPFQHLNILSLPKIYTLSEGKFMHSYHNQLLPNHFDEYFIPFSSIHSHSTRLATSNNLFLSRVNSSSGKCSLAFVGPKVWSSIPNHIKSSTTFTFRWKLKKHLRHDKDTELWTFAKFHLSRTKFCKFCNFSFCVLYVYLLFAFLLPCAHPILFSMKAHSIVFFVCFFSSVPH